MTDNRLSLRVLLTYPRRRIGISRRLTDCYPRRLAAISEILTVRRPCRRQPRYTAAERDTVTVSASSGAAPQSSDDEYRTASETSDALDSDQERRLPGSPPTSLQSLPQDQGETHVLHRTLRSPAPGRASCV